MLANPGGTQRRSAEMQHQDLKHGFRIDDIVVEPLDGTLTLPGGETRRLEPKVMEVLLTLAGGDNRTVSRADLLETVWAGQIAADELLTRAISEIRRALRDDPRNPTFIRTVPKRGYRLIGNVRLHIDTPKPRADGARIAGIRPVIVLGLVALAVGYLTINGIAVNVPASIRDEGTAGLEVARSPTAGPPMPLTSTEGSEWAPALSPDGKFAAFVSSPPGNFKFGDIHVVEVGSAMPVPLTTNAEAGNRAPTWSPDGTRIAFVRSLDDGRNEIVVKPVLGGVETRLATIDIFSGHDWSPGGDRLAVAISEAYPARPRVYLLSISDGSLTAFTDPGGLTGDRQPRFSPDGKTLAFLRSNADGSAADLCLKQLVGSSVNCITPADKKWPVRDFAWSPNGESLIVSVDGLVRVPVSGAPVESLPFGNDAYNVATARHANSLVYESFIEDSNLWRVPGPAASSPGSPERLIASTQVELLPRYSPDGSKIAFVSGRTGGWEVWVARADGSQPRRLTEWGYAAFPDWSPDGRLITFSTGRYAVGRGEQAIEDVGFDPEEAFSVEAAGGVPRMISDGESGAKAPSWSADGQYVFFTRGGNDCGSEELWRRRIDSGEESRLTECAWRPLAGGDGRVYFFNKAANGISSVSMTGADERLELTSDAGCETLNSAWTIWRSNLVYLDCEDRTIKMLNLDTRQTTDVTGPFAKEQLFEYFSLDVSPDGQWMLFSRLDRAASDLILIKQFQ